MSHNYHKPVYRTSYRPLNHQEMLVRFETLELLQAYIPYIKYIPSIDTAQVYSNELLSDLNFELNFATPENQFENRWELKSAYQKLVHASNDVAEYFKAQQEELKEYYSQMQQQGQLAQENYNPVGYSQGNNNQNAYYQQSPAYNTQGYNNQGYNNQGYNNQGYNNQGYNNQGYNNQGYNNQGYNNQGYNNQGYNNQGYNNQGYNNQGNSQRHNERRNQEGTHRQNYRNNQQQGVEGRYAGHGNYNKSGGDNHRRNNFHEKGHYQQNHQHQAPHVPEKFFAEDEVDQTQEIVQEVIAKPEPVVQAPPPPPPKPQPKPTKFSISQIKDFINSFSKQEHQKHVNSEVIEKVKEIKEWKSEEVEVEFKQEPNKYQKRDNKKQQQQQQQQQDGGKPAAIKTGVRRDEAQQAKRMGYKGQGGQNKVTIVLGAKETMETRQMKEQLRKKATDFVGQKLEEEKNLDQVQKDRKEILFNLNLIVPENLKDIEKDLIHYLCQDEQVCKILVQETIKKAWDQPKYASTYAKLCQDFSKKHYGDFKFEWDAKKDKKDNPFKLFLVESVQHSFDQRIEKFPAFESAEDKQLFLKDFKKKILSNVKFIAELIICKVLKRKIIKYCISQLFEFFLTHYYAYVHDKQIEDSVYDYHYEAIIELIENVGEKFDTIDEKEKEKEQKQNYSYNEIKKHIEEVLKLSQPPKKEIIELTAFFTGDEYFELLSFINSTYMKKNFPRLGALLQNLIERRNNNWQKHLSMAEGPKKLKDIQEDIEHEQDQGKTKVSKEQVEQEKLDKKVKEMFEGWEMGKNEEQKEMRDISRKHSETSFYFSLLKQVADEKKENVAKRVTLFPLIMDAERFKPEAFRNAWAEAVKYLAIGGEDFPFCGAAMAKILACAVEKGGKLEDYHRKYEDDEEQYFSEEILRKYYFYTKDEAALKIVKPKAKYSGLI